MRQPKIFLGQRGEDRAANFLIAHGYQIQARNCRVANDEVDIVALDLTVGELVFVEVKTRHSDQYGWGSDAVDGRKLARMGRVARALMRERRWRGDFRFDIICITGQHVEHYQNVTWSS